MPIMATGFDDKPSSNQWQRRIDISATYYVALPFLKTEDAIATGQAQEMPSASAAVRRAELMSRDPLNAGALAFRRSGNPNLGDFGEPTILGTFGEVPSSPKRTLLRPCEVIREPAAYRSESRDKKTAPSGAL